MAHISFVSFIRVSRRFPMLNECLDLLLIKVVELIITALQTCNQYFSSMSDNSFDQV